MQTFFSWLKNETISESDTRYSVEVNFRTRTAEVLKHAAKITLGCMQSVQRNRKRTRQ